MEYSEQIVNWLKEIGNLAMQEIPPFIQEVATYGFYTNLISAFGFLIFTVLSVLAFFYIRKECKRTEEYRRKNCDGSDAYIAGMCTSVFFFIVFFILMFGSIESSVKALVSPKLYVIERFMKK